MESTGDERSGLGMHPYLGDGDAVQGGVGLPVPPRLRRNRWLSADHTGIDAIARTTLTVGIIAMIGGGLLLYRGLRRRRRDVASPPVDLRDEQPVPE